MKVKCITNAIKDLPEEYHTYHQTTHERDLSLTVGKEYVVMGVTSEDGKILYYINLDHGVYWMSPAFFEIVDNRLPDDWAFRTEPDMNGKDFMISFSEWLEHGFIDDYYEGEAQAVNIVNEKIEKYKNL